MGNNARAAAVADFYAVALESYLFQTFFFGAAVFSIYST